MNTKQKTKSLLPLILFLLAGACLASAGELDLAKARELAAANSRTLRKALLSVDSAATAEQAQAYALLPQASLTLGGSLSYPASSLSSSAGVSAALKVTQVVYEGGKNKILASIDRLATEEARAKARAEYLAVLQAADEAYFAVLKAQAALEAAQSDLDASRLHQSIAQAKYEAGIVIKSSVVEAQAETASKETALSQAKRSLSVAKASLASLTGGSDLPAAIDLSTYQATTSALSALDESGIDRLVAALEAKAAGSSPSLAASASALEQARLGVEAAKSAYLPSVSAIWRQEAAYDAASGLELSASGSLGVEVSIPLDQHVTGNTVRAKSIAAEQAALDKDQATADLRLDIRGAVYDLVADLRSIDSSRKALDYAESNYTAKLELFRLSKASSSDLSDAELLLSSSRSALISAQYAFLSGLSGLKTLVGLEEDGFLVGLAR